MSLEISDEEARAIRWALDNYLPELSYEVARIKLERDRHWLAEREALLQRVRQRLTK